MVKTKVKINKYLELKNLFYIASTILLILFSMLNLQTSKSNVLGASVQIDYSSLNHQKEFWEEFLSINPTYYDGWKELSEINLLLGNFSQANNLLKIAKRIDFTR